MENSWKGTCWDPLRKKEVTATPEEMVRQWFILLLHNSFSVPFHMMMSEQSFSFGKKRYRADIVVYDRQGKALMVAECKREDVKIDAEVAEQALRYNSVLGVRYIVLTNRKKTYLYELKDGVFVPCEHFPNYEDMILCRR